MNGELLLGDLRLLLLMQGTPVWPWVWRSATRCGAGRRTPI